MSWRYGIMEHRHGKDKYYQIHEIYHTRGKIGIGYSKEAIIPQGDTIKGLKRDLRLMLKDINKCCVYDYETGKKIRG